MTTSTRYSLGRQSCAFAWCFVVCVAFAPACGLSDATVYQALRESEAGRGGAGRAGAGGAGGVGAAAGMAGSGGGEVCTRGSDGATLAGSILDVIQASVTFSCESDADCSVTPVFPRCDPVTSMCAPCPDLAAKIVQLTACLADARDRCCNSPESPVDCIYRVCVPGCDGQ